MPHELFNIELTFDNSNEQVTGGSTHMDWTSVLCNVAAYNIPPSIESRLFAGYQILDYTLFLRHHCITKKQNICILLSTIILFTRSALVNSYNIYCLWNTENCLISPLIKKSKKLLADQGGQRKSRADPGWQRKILPHRPKKENKEKNRI